MNTMRALTRALPLSSRQCQFGAPSRLVRPFTSSQKVQSNTKDNIEDQMLETNPQQSQDGNADSSPLSAITKMMMQGERTRSNQSVSRDYSRMAESLEAEMIKQPYADRSPPHHLHIYAHKHNTLMLLARPNGSPLLSLSCGNLGFRKGHRSGYDPAYQLAVHVFGQIQERGYILDIQRLEVIYRGFGPGRDAVTKVLLGNEGRNIRGLVSRVTDSTRIKFGGTRSRAVRRL